MLRRFATDQRFRGSYICATNLGFDLAAMFKTGKRMITSLEIVPRGSDVIIATCYVPYSPDGKMYRKASLLAKGEDLHDFYKLTWLDSINHYGVGVEALGKLIGSPKLNTPPFIGKLPKTPDEWTQLKTYNIQDATVTYNFMKWMQNEYNQLGATMKCTAPSTSVDLLRRKFLPMTILQPPRAQVLKDYTSYYGGRTEAFHRGHYKYENWGNIFVYDVNSLYPYCMKSKPFPDPSQFIKYDKISAADISAPYGYATFELKCPADNLLIPILPVKTDKLRFPTGYIKGTYDFYSVKMALDLGYEFISGKNATIYTQTIHPFKDYIDTLYAKRQELQATGNAEQIIVKLLMNSLYGKFGQRFNNKERLILNEDEIVERTKDWTVECTPYSITGIMKMSTTDDSRIPAYVNPVIASYITSYARSHLFKLMRQIGYERVMYCDTDSLFTPRVISTSGELGALKLEKTYRELLIVKAKMYAGIESDGKEIIKIKGVKRPKLPTDDYGIKSVETLLKQIETSNAVSANMPHFTKFRSGLKSPDNWINKPTITHKVLKLDDDKRLWPDKFKLTPTTSKPLVLSPVDYIDA